MDKSIHSLYDITNFADAKISKPIKAKPFIGILRVKPQRHPSLLFLNQFIWKSYKLNALNAKSDSPFIRS